MTSINPTVSNLIYVGTSGPILQRSGATSLVPFILVCLSPEDPQAIPPNCWKRTDEKPTETAVEIGGAHDFLTHKSSGCASFWSFGWTKSGFDRSKHFRQRMSRCAPSFRWVVLWPCHDTCFTHDIPYDIPLLEIGMSVWWCFMEISLPFHRKKTCKDISSKWLAITVHSCTARGSTLYLHLWISASATGLRWPSRTIRIDGRIVWPCLQKPMLLCLSKQSFPANIQSAVTTKVQVHVISMWTSQEHLRLSWCKLAQVLAILCKVNLASIWTIDALTYCTANNTVYNCKCIQKGDTTRHKHPNMQHLTQLYHVLNITSHSITHSSAPSKLPYAWATHGYATLSDALARWANCLTFICTW